MTGGSPFFEIFVEDDQCTVARFAPGVPGPHATETTIINNSPAGLPMSVTRNGDVLETYSYDTAARHVSSTNPGVQTVTMTLDACGNPVSTVVTAHATIPGTPDETFTTTASYDAACRWVSTSDSVGNTLLHEYDSQNRVTSETLPGGLVMHHAYDSVSLMGAFSSEAHSYSTGLMGEVTCSSICLAGECVSATDVMGYTTSFTSDAQGRATGRFFPDGTFETRTFDALGHVASFQRQDGTLATSSYDLRGRRTVSIVTSPLPGVLPGPPIECAYDGLDRCVLLTEGGSTVACAFDSLGNLLSESQNGHATVHTYSHRGETGVSSGGGLRFHMERNAQGQLVSFSRVHPATGAVLSPPLSACDFSGFDCVREIRADGVVTTSDIRSDGEQPLSFPGGHEDFSFGECVRSIITGPTGTVLEDHVTRRNRDQCETQHLRAFAGGAAPPLRLQTFTLDERNLATRCVTQVRTTAGAAAVTESDVQYELDARGQRTSATGSSEPGLYTSSDLFPGADRQMAQYSTWSRGALTWDPNGGLTHLSRGPGGMDLVYDARFRLTDVLNSATGIPLASYGYDGCGRRTATTTYAEDGFTTETTFFIYNGDLCILELNALGTVVKSFATDGTNSICFSDENGNPSYTHSGEMAVRGKVKDIRDTGIGRLHSPGCDLITSSTGTPIERLACDDACRPIFLGPAGLARPGATTTLTGLRWLSPDGAWCPESSLFQCGPTFYSPELGQSISPPSAGKKEFKGHVTLLK